MPAPQVIETTAGSDYSIFKDELKLCWCCFHSGILKSQKQWHDWLSEDTYWHFTCYTCSSTFFRHSLANAPMHNYFCFHYRTLKQKFNYNWEKNENTVVTKPRNERSHSNSLWKYMVHNHLLLLWGQRKEWLPRFYIWHTLGKI